MASTFLAARGARETAAEPVSQAVQPPPPAVDKPADKPVDPNAPLPEPQPLNSARFSMTFTQVGGKPEDQGSGKFSGAFESTSPAEVPKYAIKVKVKTGGSRTDVGVVSLGDRGVLISGDRQIEVPPQGWAAFTRLRAQAAQLAGAAKQPTPANGLFGLDPASWIAEPKRRPGPTVEGMPTVVLAGTVSPKLAFNDLKQLGDALDSDGKSDITGSDLRKFTKGVSSARLRLVVGASDGIIRKAALRLRGVEEGRPYRFRFDVAFSKVNKPQAISAPAGAGAPLPAGKARKDASGILVVGHLAAGMPSFGAAFGAVKALNEQQKAQERAAPKQLKAAGVPAPVARALVDRKVVVLFFRQAAADDLATAEAVNGVRGMKGVAVFAAPIAKLAKYRGLVSGLGIAQAPAVVVVHRSRQAQLIEGFVDPASLKQVVEDAR